MCFFVKEFLGLPWYGSLTEMTIYNRIILVEEKSRIASIRIDANRTNGSTELSGLERLA